MEFGSIKYEIRKVRLIKSVSTITNLRQFVTDFLLWSSSFGRNQLELFSHTNVHACMKESISLAVE
jgi:hypothetical protein